MKKSCLSPEAASRNKTQEEDPKYIFFCEKQTGLTRFRAEVKGSLESEAERVAGVLAMQCFVRGQNPDEFMILLPAEKPLADRLVSRANQLLEEGRSIQGPAFLSPRQTEVLHALLRNKANKEIAARMNITIRTVKFHISVLLNKFGVQSRTELARRAASLLRPSLLQELCPAPDSVAIEPGDRALGPIAVKKPLPLAPAARTSRFLGQVLTA
jgi:DNA-binding NarL/FixJ family response regulator